MNTRDKDRHIRCRIRRTRLIRRLRFVWNTIIVLLVISSGVLALFSVRLSLRHQRMYRISIQENRHLLVEQGRRLPWLEFAPANIDLPALQPDETAKLAAHPTISAASPQPWMFSNVHAMKQSLSELYRIAGSAKTGTTLHSASRAVALLETSYRLNPDNPPADLIAALITLSDRFAGRSGGRNRMEAWRCLRQAQSLTDDTIARKTASDNSNTTKPVDAAAAAPVTAIFSSASDSADAYTRVTTYQTTITNSMRRLSGQLERYWFHRVREHLRDGSYHAANVIVTELENIGFERTEVRGFRERLNRVSAGDIP
jgi:hypothetical protein